MIIIALNATIIEAIIARVVVVKTCAATSQVAVMIATDIAVVYFIQIATIIVAFPVDLQVVIAPVAILHAMMAVFDIVALIDVIIHIIVRHFPCIITQTWTFPLRVS